MNSSESPKDLSYEHILTDIEQADVSTSNPTKFEILGQKFSSYELGFLWFYLCCFLAAYIVCYLAGITYASPIHTRILYSVFVLLNVTASAICFFAWVKIPTRSLARDATLFFNMSLASAATGNVIDFLFWIFNLAGFKQSVFVNLFFVFAIQVREPRPASAASPTVPGFLPVFCPPFSSRFFASFPAISA